MAAAVKVNASAGAEGFFANSNAGSGTTLFLDAGPLRSVLHLGVAAYDDAAVQTAVPEVWTVLRSAGAKPTLEVNGIPQALSGASTVLLDPGAGAALVVGAYYTGAITGWASIDAYACLAWARDLSVIDRAEVTRYLRALVAT